MENDEIDLQQLANQMNEADEPETELDEDQPETESEDGEADTEEQEPETEDGDEEDQPEAESTDDAAIIKWKTAAGEEFEAPISELKAGYMRNQDYTQKAQALATEKRQAQEQLNQQYQKATQYAMELASLAAADQQVKQLEEYVNRLSPQDDPTSYNTATSQLMNAQRQRDGLAARITQIQQERTAAQQQATLQAQQQAIAELTSGPNALPNFGPELVKRIEATGKQYGLTDDELSAIVEPKHIRILHDAMMYRELQAKKPAAVKKVAAAKPARQTRSVPPSTIDRTLKRFNANPSIEDMARLMSATK